MKLSIIVPILDEAAGLPNFLAALAPLLDQDVEFIVVDGGSTDASLDLANASPAKVLQCLPGRARQMNAGAAIASGDVLLFLHADTQLPNDALQRIESALTTSARVWGRFDVTINSTRWTLSVVARLLSWRSRLSGIATGDQAMFVTRAGFVESGGFPDLPIMEDIELSKRLKLLSAPICLHARVLTSGRRWETRGTWRTILLMWRLRWAYWRGADVHLLARDYR